MSFTATRSANSYELLRSLVVESESESESESQSESESDSQSESESESESEVLSEHFPTSLLSPFSGLQSPENFEMMREVDEMIEARRQLFATKTWAEICYDTDEE